jgi:metallo-beta-lactamase family protein
MKIQFHGAAGGVTGSKHLVEVGNKKILLDCGMYQGRRKEADTLNRNFPFNAKEIDAVILSHAHIDHSGLLPILAKNGYAGDIFCTPATSDIMGPMLLDAAHIQEADAAYFMRKKNLRKNAVFSNRPPFYHSRCRSNFENACSQKTGETI